jgi:hypothetical protein
MNKNKIIAILASQIIIWSVLVLIIAGNIFTGYQTYKKQVEKELLIEETFTSDKLIETNLTEITSIKITGDFTGTTRVYAIAGEQKLLVFTSTEEGETLIGLVIEEGTIEEVVEPIEEVIEEPIEEEVVEEIPVEQPPEPAEEPVEEEIIEEPIEEPSSEEPLEEPLEQPEEPIIEEIIEEEPIEDNETIEEPEENETIEEPQEDIIEEPEIPEENETIEENLTEEINITIEINETTNETENITINETNITIEVNDTIENITEEIIEEPENKTYKFEKVCVETCDVELPTLELLIEVNGSITIEKIIYTKEIEEEIIINETEINFTINDTNITINETNITINDTNITINGTNITINETIQYEAIAGQPVKWGKRIKLENKTDNLTIKLPKNAAQDKK